MLAVTIPDLKPTSQDTSSFYLENIYELFATTNSFNASIPSALAKPPVFSPPRYAIWVNSLWLLALLISLSGATLATLEQRCVLRYIAVTRKKEYSPEKRARIRAAFVKNEEASVHFRDSSMLPFCLQLSLFLFMAGVLIYFFNINRAAFGALVWLIGSVTLLYVTLTVAPIFIPDELFYTPFTPMSSWIYIGLSYTVYQVCSWIKPVHRFSDYTRKHYRDLTERYGGGFIEGKRKWAEEAASKPSWEIDTEVLERMLIVMDEDHELEKLFDAIPGFCESKLVQKPLDSRVTTKLRRSLDEFLDRTFSSHLVPQSVRNDRLITCLDAAHSTLGPSGVSQILGNFYDGNRDDALKSVEIGHSLISWDHNSDDLIGPDVRRIVACIIARVRDRDDRWTNLVKVAFGVPDGVFRDYLTHGDSVSLAILIHVTREALRTGRSEQGVLKSLSQFDVHNTVTDLQREFCTLWNQVVQGARNDGFGSTRTQILAAIRRPFAALHQANDITRVGFFATLDSIDDLDNMLGLPSSYPPCSVLAHHSDSSTHGPASVVPAMPTLALLRDLPKTSTRPALLNQPHLPVPSDATIEDVMPGNADIPVNAELHGSSDVPAPQPAEENRPTFSSFAIDSLPTPIPTPALNRGASPVVLPPFIDSAVTQTDHVPLAPGAPSSTPTTIPLSVALQITTVSGPYPTVHDGTVSARGDIQDPRPSITREDYSQPPPGGATGL